MAGKMKDRDFVDAAGKVLDGEALLNAVTAFTSHDVKLPNGSYVTQTLDGPVSFPAMVKYLEGASVKEQRQAFTFYWRGRESMSAQKARLENDTQVDIPGSSKTLDLMAIPVPVACQAINVHDQGIKLLTAAAADMPRDEDDDEGEVDEDTEKLRRKNRAWNNARRFLLESGKAVEVDGNLSPNPEYKVPNIKGSSDLDTFLDSLMPEKGKRKGKKKK